MRSVSSHEGRSRCSIPIGTCSRNILMCLQMLWFLSLHACQLSVPHTFFSLRHDPSCLATWSISKICDRLFTTLFNFLHVFIRSLNTRVELREKWTPAKYGRLYGVEQGVCNTLYSSFGLPCNSCFALAPRALKNSEPVHSLQRQI